MSQSSEGYRSSAEIDQEVEKIVADTFKIPLRQETIEKEEKPERKIIERPRKGSALGKKRFVNVSSKILKIPLIAKSRTRSQAEHRRFCQKCHFSVG